MCFPAGFRTAKTCPRKRNTQGVLTGQTVMSDGTGRLISSSSTCVGSFTPRCHNCPFDPKTTNPSRTRVFRLFFWIGHFFIIKNTSSRAFTLRTCQVAFLLLLFTSVKPPKRCGTRRFLRLRKVVLEKHDKTSRQNT